MVSGRFAEIEELTGIGGGLGELAAGAFGMNSDFEDEAAEFQWITRLGLETRRPVWFLLTDRPTDPQRWRRIMTGVRQARAAGASVTAQIAGRPVGVILGIATSLNPFSIRERYKPLESLPLADRMARLRDPALRRAIIEDRPSAALMGRLGPLIQLVATRWDRMYVMGDPPDYEPRTETSVAAIAARTNHSPDEVAYDYLTESAGNFLFFPVTGYAQDDHEPIREMLTDPATLLGLGDGGAHVAQIVDASMPSYMLTHWARDRRRGPGLAARIHRQTLDQRDRRFLRVCRSRSVAAGQAGRRQRDRSSAAATASAGNRPRPAGGWQEAGPARRWLFRDLGRRHRGVRAGQAHWRDDRTPRPPRSVDLSRKGLRPPHVDPCYRARIGRPRERRGAGIR